MALGTWFEVAGRDGNSDSFDRFQAKFWSKCGCQKFHGRIMPSQEYSICNSRGNCLAVPASERLVPIALCQVPDRFPRAEGANPAQDSARARFEESCETASHASQILNTI